MLGNFKMAIVLEGGYARMLSGASDNPNAAALRRLRDAVGHQGRRHRPLHAAPQGLTAFAMSDIPDPGNWLIAEVGPAEAMSDIPVSGGLAHR